MNLKETEARSIARQGSGVTMTDDLNSVREALPRRLFLHRLNPLAKVAAPLPAVALLFFVRDMAIPIGLGLLALTTLCVGARPRPPMALTLVLGTPALIALLTVSVGVWTDPAGVADTPILVRIGDISVREGALLVGFLAALRMVAILLSMLLLAAGTDGPELVRALVAQLRVPYRFGYAALAAFHFVPRFKYELDLIRQAHRVRGTGSGCGPVAAARRGWGYLIPLLAGAIRHAERVALAMDARAFGAYPIRTERDPSRWRASDSAFVLLYWAVAGVIVGVAVLLELS